MNIFCKMMPVLMRVRLGVISFYEILSYLDKNKFNPRKSLFL